MHSFSKARKSLLIFDLDGLLCHYTKKYKKKVNVQGVYAQGSDIEAKPAFVDESQSKAIYTRPMLNKITFDILINQKSMYDIAVWSSADMDDTQLMIKHVFGRFYTQ